MDEEQKVVIDENGNEVSPLDDDYYYYKSMMSQSPLDDDWNKYDNE